MMRVTDAFQTVPGFLLALAFVSVLGPSLPVVVVAIALGSWPGPARVARAEVLSLRERDFVAAGARTYLALLDGVVAGGGGLRITDGVAHLVGAAAAPEHRRRGVQSALLTKRLADAAGAGCDIAAVTTAPGSKSQQNVQRQDFHLLYTRAVLVK